MCNREKSIDDKIISRLNERVLVDSYGGGGGYDENNHQRLEWVELFSLVLTVGGLSSFVDHVLSSV